MKNIINLILSVIALGLPACAGGGGSSGGSSADSAVIGKDLGFKSSTDIAGLTRQLSYPICVSPSNVVTATGMLIPSLLINDRTMWITVTMRVNADSTFTKVITGTDCTATITGNITLNATTRKATLTNQHSTTSTHATCSIPARMAANIGASYYNNGDISFTVNQNGTIADKTLDYIRMSTDGGFGLYDSTLIYTGDNNSKCYQYYYSPL